MNNSVVCVPKLIYPSTDPGRRRFYYPESPKTFLQTPSNGACIPTYFPKACCEPSKPLQNTPFTKVQRQVRLISYRPQRKTFFGDGNYSYFTSRQNIGGKIEGQLGGSLDKLKLTNF